MTMNSIVKIRMNLLFPVRYRGMNDVDWWVGDVCGCGFTTEFNFEERVPSLTYPINNIARCIKCSREFFFFL